MCYSFLTPQPSHSRANTGERMIERNWTARRRSVVRSFTWTITAIAAGVGSVEVAGQWKEVLLGPRQPAGLTQDHGSRAEINRDATLGTVQTVTGNVAQDYSRNFVLYNLQQRLPCRGGARYERGIGGEAAIAGSDSDGAR